MLKIMITEIIFHHNWIFFLDIKYIPTSIAIFCHCEPARNLPLNVGLR